MLPNNLVLGRPSFGAPFQWPLLFIPFHMVILIPGPDPFCLPPSKPLLLCSLLPTCSASKKSESTKGLTWRHRGFRSSARVAGVGWRPHNDHADGCQGALGIECQACASALFLPLVWPRPGAPSGGAVLGEEGFDLRQGIQEEGVFTGSVHGDEGDWWLSQSHCSWPNSHVTGSSLSCLLPNISLLVISPARALQRESQLI